MVDIVLDTDDNVLHHFALDGCVTTSRRNYNWIYFCICHDTMAAICQMDLQEI